MSHLKFPPTIKSSLAVRHVIFAAFFVALGSSGGCAMIQIPSYRLEECAAEEYSSTPALMPPLPMPGWLARWKAEKDLPKPPASPRFHPLPTRPMFQPQTTPNLAADGFGGGACYGQLPTPESWNANQPLLEQRLGQPPLVQPTPTLAGPQ